jgi:elongation factor G
LIEKIANVDDEIQELFIDEKEITVKDLQAAIRRQTIANTFVPVNY